MDIELVSSDCNKTGSLVLYKLRLEIVWQTKVKIQIPNFICNLYMPYKSLNYEL